MSDTAKVYIAVAADQELKNASSITGNKDMTLYEILELIIRQRKGLVMKTDKNMG